MMGSKGWCSGESAHLPPMWSGFKFRRRRHMLVKFVVGSLLCSERFLSGYSGFPSSQKPTFPNPNSTRNQVDEEPLCGCATCTSKSLFIYLFIHLFIYCKLHITRTPQQVLQNLYTLNSSYLSCLGNRFFHYSGHICYRQESILWRIQH